MPNLRLGSARTAPVVLEAHLRRDAGASLPGLRPFDPETVHWTVSETDLTPSVRARQLKRSFGVSRQSESAAFAESVWEAGPKTKPMSEWLWQLV